MAVCVSATGVVEGENVPEVVPAEMVMAAGSLTTELLDDESEIEAPPAGAALEIVTVQVLLEPPASDNGAHTNWKRGAIVKDVVSDAPP